MSDDSNAEVEEQEKFANGEEEQRDEMIGEEEAEEEVIKFLFEKDYVKLTHGTYGLPQENTKYYKHLIQFLNN